MRPRADWQSWAVAALALAVLLFVAWRQAAPRIVIEKAPATIHRPWTEPAPAEREA